MLREGTDGRPSWTLRVLRSDSSWGIALEAVDHADHPISDLIGFGGGMIVLPLAALVFGRLPAPDEDAGVQG